MKFKVDVDITVNNQKDQEFNDEIGSAKGRSFNNPTLTPHNFPVTTLENMN